MFGTPNILYFYFRLPCPGHRRRRHRYEDFADMDNEHSDNAPGHNKPVEIIVNGQPCVVTEQRISYEEVVRLAFPAGPFDITYTVDYATEHGHDGTLTKGQSTKVHKGMNFNVVKSNRS